MVRICCESAADPLGVCRRSAADLLRICCGSAADLLGMCCGCAADLVRMCCGSVHGEPPVIDVSFISKLSQRPAIDPVIDPHMTMR